MGVETVIALGVTLAATGAGIAQQRDARRDAIGDQRAQVARARKDQENAKIQKDATLGARAARAQQLAMGGQGYDSTISTSPTGLSGGGKSLLGQ